ncbi:MAG: hypothetical protein KGV44_08975 [Flavobacteriaceae bacterium]|nr:hypothetical protein [Flavobacteriaceae bacterium]
MKKSILLLSLIIGISSYSQSGFKHLTLKGGYNFIDPAINVELGLEFNQEYFTNWSIFVSAYQNETLKNYTAGVYYEPNIYAAKNQFLNFKFGSSLGSNQKRFIMDAIVGMEYSYAFTDNLEFSAFLKNNYMFWSKKGFRNAILIGLKYRL